VDVETSSPSTRNSGFETCAKALDIATIKDGSFDELFLCASKWRRRALHGASIYHGHGKYQGLSKGARRRSTLDKYEVESFFDSSFAELLAEGSCGSSDDGSD
jgi:hypothetical protein